MKNTPTAADFLQDTDPLILKVAADLEQDLDIIGARCAARRVVNICLAEASLRAVTFVDGLHEAIMKINGTTETEHDNQHK